jgi:ribosomal protein L15
MKNERFVGNKFGSGNKKPAGAGSKGALSRAEAILRPDTSGLDWRCGAGSAT